jgi:hypothetical protein
VAIDDADADVDADADKVSSDEQICGRRRASPEPDYRAAHRQLKPHMSRRFRECVGEGMQDSWPAVLTVVLSR